MSASEITSDPHRQQQLYWNEMIDLKSEASYIRLYRDSLGRWVTSIGALKAIASSAGIAAWVIWKEYAFVWGFIIALSQVADALKDVFPFARKHKAACVYSMTIDNLFNDVQLEWENISSGRYTDEEIMKRLHQLRKLRLDALQHNFPDGLAARNPLAVQAKQVAEDYFQTAYGVK
jgi:hypothetical protein